MFERTVAGVTFPELFLARFGQLALEFGDVRVKRQKLGLATLKASRGLFDFAEQLLMLALLAKEGFEEGGLCIFAI